MGVILTLLGTFVADLFKSRQRLEVENLFLRHQLSIALRRAPCRLHLRGCDRALLVWMASLWPSLVGLSRVVQPDTILRWHRSGFRACWRWKSRGQPGKPRISRELRELIRQMNKDNPRIHGELLKLGFELAQSTVSRYMIEHRGPPSQAWRTFLRNLADAIAAIDLCVVPTLTFGCLFAFLVVSHAIALGVEMVWSRRSIQDRVLRTFRCYSAASARGLSGRLSRCHTSTKAFASASIKASS
jgi:hypothetical protein